MFGWSEGDYNQEIKKRFFRKKFCWVNTFAYLCGMNKELKEFFANKEMAQQEGGWLKIGHIKTETMELYSTCPSVTLNL